MPAPKKPGGTGDGLPSIGIRLDPKTAKLLEVFAKIQGRTRSELLRDLINDQIWRYTGYLQYLSQSFSMMRIEDICAREIPNLEDRIKEAQTELKQYAYGGGVPHIASNLQTMERDLKFLKHVNRRNNRYTKIHGDSMTTDDVKTWVQEIFSSKDDEFYDKYFFSPTP